MLTNVTILKFLKSGMGARHTEKWDEFLLGRQHGFAQRGEWLNQVLKEVELANSNKDSIF